MNIIPRLKQLTSDMREIRQDLHAHPELSFQEYRTSERVATLLQNWGVEVHRGLAGTGVVGTLRQGASTKSVGLRADMDALPLQEHNHFSHASKHPGKMHACGHDGHTAMLLAAARYLAETRHFDGTVNFIFQPAEEGGAGAQRMMDDGLFEQFPCDAVFGMHNWPGMPVGTFGLRPGPMMAGSNEFELVIRGKGAHAAMPHLGVDPIVVACQVAQGFQLLVSREKKPMDAAVVSVTQIHAGDAYNIIPNEAIMRGTVRTFSFEVLDHLESGMQRIAENTAAAFNASVEFRFHRNYPPTVNHRHETEFAARVMEDIVGPDNVMRDCEPTMGAEDFAFMLRQRPGCYVFIGNGQGEHRANGHGMGPCMLHNPSYDFNDELIPLGATYWARLVEKFLKA